MAAESATITFDDFSGGEYGDKGAHRAAPNEWTGRNVMVGQDGCIGPRPGIRKHTLTGNPAGDVWCIKYIGRPGKMLLVAIDDEIYSTDVDSGTIAFTLADTLDDTPTEHLQVDFHDPNDELYLTNPGFKTYVLDWPAGTLAEITINSDSHGFRGVKAYRDRLYLFDDATSPSGDNPSFRVYYSAAADFTNMDDGGNFDVGYFGDLYAACPLANHLYFPQRAQQGSAGGWWALIGGNPVNQQLRQIRTDPPQFNASSGASQAQYVVENGSIWYFRPSGRLAVTNGAQFDEKTWAHLQLGPVSDVRYGLALSEDGQDVVYSDGNTSLIRHWGTWGFHDFDVELDGQISNTEFKNRVIYVGDADGAGKQPLYSLDLSLDRPGFIDDDHARPGDHSDTPLEAYFVSPLWRDKKDREFRVRQVIVDLIKYDWTSDAGEGGEQTSLTVEARTYNRANVAQGDTDDYALFEQEWTEDATLSTAAGVRDRVRFNFHGSDMGYGGAFEIKFTPVGCKVEKFDVFIEYHPGRGQR